MGPATALGASGTGTMPGRPCDFGVGTTATTRAADEGPAVATLGGRSEESEAEPGDASVVDDAAALATVAAAACVTEWRWFEAMMPVRLPAAATASTVPATRAFLEIANRRRETWSSRGCQGRRRRTAMKRIP